MNCKNCGFILTPEDKFCKSCGTPVDTPSVQPTQDINNGMNNMTNDIPAPSMPAQNIQPDVTMQAPVQPDIQMQTPNTNQAPFPNVTEQPAQASVTPVATTTNVKKSSKALIFIIIGLITAGIVAAGIIFIPKLFNGSSSGTGTNNGGGTETPPSAVASYKVNFQGFNFTIPGDYVYKTSGDYLMIGDEQGTWMANISIEEGSYTSLKSNMNKLQAYFQEKGYTAGAPKTSNYGSLEFLTYEIGSGGTNALIAYSKLTSMHVTAIEAYDLNNEFNYDILKNISSIISSAEASTSSNFIAPELNVGSGEAVQLAQ